MPNSHKATEETSSDDQGVVLTSNSLIKWGGFLAALVGGLITLVLYIGTIKSDVAHNTEKLHDYDRDLRLVFIEADKVSAQRDATQQIQINELKHRVDDSDRNVAELTRKVDVLTVKLDYVIELLKNPPNKVKAIE